jgi:hypothetical protein
MAEVDHGEIGAEFGLSEVEAKDLYDQWTQVEDPLTLDYPGDKFREYVKQHYALSGNEQEEEEEEEEEAGGFTFAETEFLGFEDEPVDSQLYPGYVDEDREYVAKTAIDKYIDGLSREKDKDFDYFYFGQLDEQGRDLFDALTLDEMKEIDLNLDAFIKLTDKPNPEPPVDSDDIAIGDEFGMTKLEPTPLVNFAEENVSEDSASFHLEKAVGFAYEDDELSSYKDEDKDEYTFETAESIIETKSLPSFIFSSDPIAVDDTATPSVTTTAASLASTATTAPASASATTQARGIDDILNDGDDNDEFLTQFASMSLADTTDYAKSHSVHIRNAMGKHQKAVAGAMLKQAEQLVKTDESNRKGFFLVVPSEASCKNHHDVCADGGKRTEFVKSHLLKQAGPVKCAALFDRPWKSLSSVATEYKFPSEKDDTLIRTRDNRAFKLAEAVESAYLVKDARKNIKVVYLAPSETARLV